MATHHRDAGCLVDRDIDLYIEDTEGTNTGSDNDNESTTGSDTTIAFGGSEVDGHPSDHMANNHAKVTALTREIHNLHQQIEAREDQHAEGLDCIKWELQNLSIMLQTQPAATLTPTEPFGTVLHQYTDTLCATQKQTHLTNSLLQDITVINEHNSSKLEEWLTDIETGTDLTNEICTK